jgi:sortase A
MTIVGERKGSGPRPAGDAVRAPYERLEFVRETVRSAIAERPQAGRAELAAHLGDSLGVAPGTALLALRTLEREGAIVSHGPRRRRSYVLPEPGPPILDGHEALNGHRPGGRVDGSLPGATQTPETEGAATSATGWVGSSRLFGRPRRRASRILAVALVTLGILGLAEAALTLLWKEPFSALHTSRAQSALAADLSEAQTLADASSNSARNQAELVSYLHRRAKSLNRETEAGSALGRLKIEKLDLNFVVAQEASEESLTQGPAHYDETPLPGLRGNWTVGVAGHRTTYEAPFRNIDDLEQGDEVVLEMPYARFTYKVEGTEIVDADDTTIFRPESYDRLALTACHPLYSDAQRIIAYAKLKRIEVEGANGRDSARNSRTLAAG